MTSFLRAGLWGLGLWCLAVASQAAEPIQVSVRTEVAVSPLHAWQRMQDFSAADRYVPKLKRTEIITPQQNGLGASRRVYSDDGDYLEETIIGWDEGQGFTLRLHRGDKPMAPLKRSEFRYEMAPMSNGNTQIKLSILLLMPMGSLGEWLGNWLVRPSMEQELTRIAAGLKHYYETGQRVTEADWERLAVAVEVLPASTD
ncbi:SRPBCC family protein [Parahaliea sp. F7430]|uniref:SRPBCC family protein n=1 Tax=Sediminihaliea albiluteola TaxID=2758564 RepID=A0A7W2TWI5_9GAMM|nr:SRPBCC family protein [Sediminihaliea albiluteola]MBA6413262.1 SRPBCC family protein [Sediminihaliea albiluteola]